MIKTKFTKVKNINYIILVVLLSSCIMIKKPDDQITIAKDIVDNYLRDFKKYYSQKELEGIMIFLKFSKESISEIVVQDYPIEHLYFDIRNISNNSSSISFGTFKGIPTKLVVSSNQFKRVEQLIETDTSLISSAKATNIVLDENDEELDIEFEEGLLEYEPLLISEYSINDKTKLMTFYDGKIIKTKY